MFTNRKLEPVWGGLRHGSEPAPMYFRSLGWSRHPDRADVTGAGGQTQAKLIFGNFQLSCHVTERAELTQH
jgi:hypothetical protein